MTFYEKVKELVEARGWVGLKPEEIMDLVLAVLRDFADFLEETEPYARISIQAINDVIAALPETEKELKGEE